MFKEVGVNRSAESCNPKLRLKHVNSSASMATQTVPPYLNWDRQESNHGPVFSVESVALCCVSYLSLFHPLFFSSPQTGFCYPVHNAGTFVWCTDTDDGYLPPFMGGYRKTLFNKCCFVSFLQKPPFIFSLKEGLFVCFSVIALWKKCVSLCWTVICVLRC